MKRNPCKPFVMLVVCGLILSGMVSGIFSAKANAAGAVYGEDGLAAEKAGVSTHLTQAVTAQTVPIEPAAAGDPTEEESSAASDTYAPETGDVPVIATAPSTTESIDTNADSMAEVGVLYDYGNTTSGLWIFDPSGSGFTSRMAWTNGAGNWDWSRTKMAPGDFNADGRTDMGILYDYGNSTSGLWVFEAAGTGFSPRLAWTNGRGNWDWASSKMSSGDFNGDGKTDIGILYDYGNSTSGLWVFEAAGTGFSPRLAWANGRGNWDWASSKIATGDFNADGNDDVGILYDYGNTTAGLWVFEAAGTGFNQRLAWTNGRGNWDWSCSKIAAGDFNGDGNSDVGILYDYGNSTSGLWVFEAAGTGFNPRQAWANGRGNWNWASSKLTPGDFNNDGKTEMGILYDYGSSTAGLWVFDPAGISFDTRLAWTNGRGNWNWSSSKVVGASNFIPRFFNMGVQWVDINLSSQTLTVIGVVVYEYEERRFSQTNQPIYSTLVSSGKPGYETPTGQYFVYSKQIAADMRSAPGAAEPYYAPAVPYVLWFTGSYSIHGANWHNNFGRAVSHGCVNLPMGAAAWVFQAVGVGMRVSVHY
ncbi:MAG: FG-GAP-like repeat-containing protein [Thermoleophilia bacterium]